MTKENHVSEWVAVVVEEIPSVSLGALGLVLLIPLLISIVTVVTVFAHPPP